MVSARLDVDLLRRLLETLQLFRQHTSLLLEDTITGPDGQQWTLWDVESLYELGRSGCKVRTLLIEGLVIGLTPTEVAAANRWILHLDWEVVTTQYLSDVLNEVVDGAIPTFSMEVEEWAPCA